MRKRTVLTSACLSALLLCLLATEASADNVRLVTRDQMGARQCHQVSISQFNQLAHGNARGIFCFHAEIVSVTNMLELQQIGVTEDNAVAISTGRLDRVSKIKLKVLRAGQKVVASGTLWFDPNCWNVDLPSGKEGVCIPPRQVLLGSAWLATD
jgi:hypothetical protein